MNKVYLEISVSDNTTEKIVCNNHMDLYDYFKNKYNPYHLEVTSDEIQLMVLETDILQIEKIKWIKEI